MPYIKTVKNAVKLFLILNMVIYSTVSHVTPCRAGEGLLFEVHLDWMIHFYPEKPHMEVEVHNYDFYDLNLVEIQIDNSTVFKGEFIVGSNKTSTLMVEDISEILEMEKEEIVLEIFIEDSVIQPAYEADVTLDYDNADGARLGYHRSYAFFVLLEHNVTSQLPDWLGPGKEMDYMYTISDQNGTQGYNLRMAIVEYFQGNSTLILAVQQEGMEDTKTEAVRMSAHYPMLVSWLNPSHIQIIKERPTSFLDNLYTYQGEENITTSVGEFEAYNFKKTQPYFVDGGEGELWVEKNSGLVLWGAMTYYGIGSEEITITHTNIFQEPSENGFKIPGFPPLAIITGIITLLALTMLNNKIKRVN